MASWYRKVDVRMCGDKKFRRLSRPHANGQTLFLHLLTGPHTEGIPGLSMIGEMGLAESLGWDLEGFRKAFAEVYREGMAEGDWEARVVLVPNAIKYNAPESPNVVRSWVKVFDMIPECDLKGKWLVRLNRYFTEEYEGSEAYAKAFTEAFGEPLIEALAQPIANPQPQPQHKPQHQEKTPASDESGLPSSMAGPKEAHEMAELLGELMRRNNPKAKVPATTNQWAADLSRLNRIDGNSWEDIGAVIRWSQQDSFWMGNIQSGAAVRKQFGKLIVQMKQKPGGGGGRFGVSANNRSALDEVLGDGGLSL